MNKGTENLSLPTKPSEISEIGPKDYEYVQELLKEMRVQVVYLRNHLNRVLSNQFQLNSDSISDSITIRKENIKNMETEELRRFLKNHQLKEGIYDEADRETLENTMTIIKDAFITLATTEKEYSDIQKDADEVTREYYEFLNSTEREQERQNRINDLKVMNETLEDEIEKRKNANKIEIMEKSYNYKFILDRLEQYGEKEVERLISIYFDRKTGSYMIDRYENKINRLGFSPDVYKNFFSIEENFLDEEYHPFNNLFLCVYMAWVSHVDVDRNDESLYAKSITGAIANLIYHKFVTDEKEKDFIELIKSVDDYFKSHIDYFIENNESYKNNPRRIEVEKEARLNSLMIFKDKYKQLGIEDKFDENKSIDEIRTIYNAELNAIIESQITSSKPDEDFKDENVIGTENDINIIKESLDEGLSEITRKENEALTKAKAETDRKIKESEEEKTNNEESSN